MAASPVVPSPQAWPWGASEQQIQTDYPPTPGYPVKNRYSGPLRLLGEGIDNASIRFTFISGKGLQRAQVSVPTDHWHRLMKVLEREYGSPRYAYTREHKLFTHYLEWSSGDVGVTASITTVGEDLDGPLYAHTEGSIAFAQGPLRASVIDAIEESRIVAKQLQEQIRLADEKATQRRSAIESDGSKHFEAALSPTEADALKWANEATERLRLAPCPSSYERSFDNFQRIFSVPGARATKALLEGGFDARQLYYGGIPASCPLRGSIAEPMIVSAMRAQNAASVALLAKRGADIEYMSLEHMCLVEEAAWRSSTEVFRALLAAGARCTAKPDGRRDLVKEVVWRQPVDKLRTLLDYKFRLTVDDLRTLTGMNDLAKVRLVEKRGYRWDAKELQLSTLMASPEMLALLIKGGADPTLHLRRLVSRDFSYGNLPNEKHCSERLRVLLANGAHVSAGGSLFPEVEVATRRAPEQVREVLIAAIDRELPHRSKP